MKRATSALAAVMLTSILSPESQALPDGLQLRQGNCFTYAVPEGWQSTDSTNGVDIMSPDGKAYVFLSLFQRGRGHQTPEGFLRLFASMGRVRDLTVTSDQPGLPAPLFPVTRIIEYTCVASTAICGKAAASARQKMDGVCGAPFVKDMPHQPVSSVSKAPGLQKLAQSIWPPAERASPGQTQ